MKTIKFGIIIGLLLSAASVFADEMYKENVVASFYADKFNGRRTASGEIFDMNEYTAAHKTLPFGTVLRVTNLENGKCVNVRINDRGPFVQGREIDVSKAAAIALDMVTSGTAKVSLMLLDNEKEGLVMVGDSSSSDSADEEDVIYDPISEVDPYTPPATDDDDEYDSSVTAAPVKSTDAAPASNETKSAEKTDTSAKKTASKETAKPERWDIQLGAFTNVGNAKVMAHKLLQAGFDNVAYQKVGEVTRVVLRDIATEDLDAVQSQLDENGFTQYIVRERKNVVTKD